MKRFFVIAVIFLTFNCAYGAIDDNVDYDFINNAFTNPNPTTNKEFEDVMNEKDKIKYDKELKTRFENPNNQPARIKDVPEEKPTILITAESYDFKGNKVDVGYYQVEFKKENGKYFLELMQGANKHIATLIAREIDEDEKAPSIVYGRAEATNNGYIKVIYANLDVTLLGFLKVREEPKQGFEAIY